VKRKPKSGSIALTVGLFAVAIGTWEALSRLGVLPRFFFPPPSFIAVTLKELAVSGELLQHAGATISRVVFGFLMGGIPAYLIGMWMGCSPSARRLIDPFVAALHPVPKISMLPIIMIVLGVGATSRTFVIALSTFFPMLINTMAGVRQIHPIYFEVAKNYGARRFQVLRKVVIPGSLPFVLAGARVALNVALSLTIAVELITADDGIGTMIWLAWQTLRIEDVYAGVVMSAVIGIGIRAVIQFLSARLVPWQVETNA
jgi:NitT/TauT family transport system permease protein